MIIIGFYIIKKLLYKNKIDFFYKLCVDSHIFFLGGLRLESPTLVTGKGTELLLKTPFKVDYI
jgi:hypothetical protein